MKIGLNLSLSTHKEVFVYRTKTLDALCYALDCEVSDIIEFVKE